MLKVAEHRKIFQSDEILRSCSRQKSLQEYRFDFDCRKGTNYGFIFQIIIIDYD